jgi:hypothetical protein
MDEDDWCASETINDEIKVNIDLFSHQRDFVWAAAW